MEWVDIVDENNLVVGRTTKTDSHRKGLLHQTVIAEVVNSKGEWLFVRQTKNRQDPGQYVSPAGGHVVAGEMVEDALKREAKEELGFEDFKYQYKGKFIYDRSVKNHRENHYFLVFEISSDQKPVANEEWDEYLYLSKDGVASKLKEDPSMFAEPLLKVFENIYKGQFV